MWANVSPKDTQGSVSRRNKGNGSEISTQKIHCRKHIIQLIQSFRDMYRMGQKYESPNEHVLSQVEQSHRLSSYFSSHM